MTTPTDPGRRPGSRPPEPGPGPAPGRGQRTAPPSTGTRRRTTRTAGSTVATASAPRPARPTRNVRPARARRGLRAGDAVAAVLIALLTAGLINAKAVIRSAEQQRPGATRSVLLTTGNMLDDVAGPLHITSIRSVMNRVRGVDDTTGGTSLLAGGRPAAGGVTPQPTGGPGAGPTPSSGHSTAPSAPAAPAEPPLRHPTAAAPARLLVTGDSLSGYFGPQLAAMFTADGIKSVTTSYDTYNGTGLTRPKFRDWSQIAASQVRAKHPDVVVMFIGGNEDIPMYDPAGTWLADGTPAWQAEYQRRVEVVSGVWLHGGAQRVYWLSVPPARTGWINRDFQRVNAALRAAAARVPGLQYFDIVPTVAPGNRYADIVTVPGQGRVDIRAEDGIHLNLAGSRIAARLTYTTLRHDWGI